MSQDYDELAKDHIAEQAYGRLAAAWDPQQQAVTDDEDRQVREQIEALAMLAYGLEPEAPTTSVKDRLMSAVAGAEAARPALPSTPTRIEAPRSAVDKTLQHSVISAVPEVSASEVTPSEVEAQAAAAASEDAADRTLVGYGSQSAPNVVPFAPRQSAGWATMALAAALAFCLVGLGYLYSQLTAQKAVLSMQEGQLAELPLLEDELSDARGQLRAMNERLAMVNTVARQAYPLRTVGASANPSPEEPFGRVFVCGQHQRWYLTVSGLDPAPSGQDYHLWYMTDEGPVDAGIVEIEGGVAGLQNLSMPDDTQGFRLTLEPGSATDSPRGRTILVGDSPVKL